MTKEASVRSLQEFEISTLLYLLDRIDKVHKFFFLFRKAKTNPELNFCFGAYSQLLPESFLISTLIYYRSLFQYACFEKKESSIEPEAYGYDKKDEEEHKKLKDHVNKTIAHQDIKAGGKFREVTDRTPCYSKESETEYTSTNSSGQQTIYSSGEHRYSATYKTGLPIEEEKFLNLIQKIKQEIENTITCHKEKQPVFITN